MITELVYFPYSFTKLNRLGWVNSVAYKKRMIEALGKLLGPNYCAPLGRLKLFAKLIHSGFAYAH